MPQRNGSNRADHFITDDRDWTLYGRGGDDELTGANGRDQLWGGNGQDSIWNYGGDDFAAGGRGNDVIYDVTGYNEIRGGVGDDLISGTGRVFGGPGNDRLELYGGVYYGDDELGLSRGDDTFHLDAPGRAPYHQLNSLVFGGQGADTYNIEFANDGIRNRVDVLDFRQADGDSFDIMIRPSTGQPGDTLFGLQVMLDTDGNGFIDGKDPASEYGTTWADPNANAVCLMTTDGDLFAIWGTQSVQVQPAPDFIL